MRRASRITLSTEEWACLRNWITDRKTPARVRLRARILLGAAVGRSNREIARTLSLDPATVSFWRHRFLRQRLEGGLRDASRAVRRRKRTPDLSDVILHATYHVRPPEAPRWTTRTLAHHLGLNHMQVHRAWRSSGVQPERLAASGGGPLTTSRGPCVDLLGVILPAPRRAAVFGVPRWDGTGVPGEAPSAAPFRPGISGGVLFASGDSDGAELVTMLEALEPLVAREGGLAGDGHDLLVLLRDLEDRTSPTMRVHVLAEIGDGREDELLRTWFDRHPRFSLHGFPSGEAWLDGVRGFLETWRRADGGGSVFGGIPAFAAAAARFAASFTPEGSGLVWSISSTTVHGSDPPVTEGADPAAPGSSRGGL